MTYDEDLADRVRGVLGERDLPPVEEKRMFGGLGFMVGGHMAVAAAGRGGLMVRVPQDQAGPLSEGEPHAAPMDMGRGPLRTWVLVEAAGLTRTAALTRWVDRGLETVAALE